MPQKRSRRQGAPQRARMEDVARAAGVSSMTVSRALAHPERVSPETRARVQRAVDKYRYLPDLLAGSLASRRTRLVGLIIPTLADSVFSDTAQGAADVLRNRGYELVIGHTGYSHEQEERLTAAMLGRRPDGMILTGVDHRAATTRLLRDASIPVVETWALTRTPIDSVVGFSNQAAGRAMTTFLVEAGYRHIGWAGSTDRRTAQRRAGYLSALRAAGLKPSGEVRVKNLNALHEGGDGIERLLQQWPEIDAVFFASDPLAMGGLFACQRRGWDVPGRVAIVGLGDVEVGQVTAPSLTTVRVPRYDLGRKAAEVLLDRIEGRLDKGAIVDVGFSIVARNTTAQK